MPSKAFGLLSVWGQKCYLSSEVQVGEGELGTKEHGNRGPWAAPHTHLGHIEQEELQVKGCGAGGHLVGDPPNAIAHLGTEGELSGSAVLRGDIGAKPPTCADTQQFPTSS